MNQEGGAGKSTVARALLSAADGRGSWGRDRQT